MSGLRQMSNRQLCKDAPQRSPAMQSLLNPCRSRCGEEFCECELRGALRVRAAWGIVSTQPQIALTRPDAIASRVMRPCSKNVADSHGQILTAARPPHGMRRARPPHGMRRAPAPWHENGPSRIRRAVWRSRQRCRRAGTAKCGCRGSKRLPPRGGGFPPPERLAIAERAAAVDPVAAARSCRLR
jgi:hypothetical protein